MGLVRQDEVLYTVLWGSSSVCQLPVKFSSVDIPGIRSLVRILFVVFAIPLAGIRGYLYGILFSEILSSSLHIYALMHNSIALPNDKKF